MAATHSWALTLALALGVALQLAGCAAPRRSVEQRYEHERVVTGDAARPAAGTTQQATVIEESTTVKAAPEERGFLSSLVHVVGEILALPFRLVGGLIRLVF